MTHRLNVVIWLKVQEYIRQQQPARIHHQWINFVHLIVDDNLLVEIVQPERIESHTIMAREDDRCNLKKRSKNVSYH